jgi:hypothetical protein
LCWIIRNGASVCQERQESAVPVGGWIVRVMRGRCYGGGA